MHRLPAVLLAVAVSACAASAPPPAPTPSAPATGPSPDPLDRVAAIHGGTGPWAVVGYRMGAHALIVLGLPRQSFDLEVEHHTPHAVQYSCIADGAAAATGASLGKLNLRLVDAPMSGLSTTYRRISTGQTITLRPTLAFSARYADIPNDKLAVAGREVMALPDEAIFETVPSP